mgnify:CR=1 FL=1
MPGIQTPICQQLQIEHPVFQAGMGWVARADLAAAVSEAGGLGCIGAGSTMDADELRAEIHSVREQTDRPFAVDILFATVAPKVNEAVRYTDKVAAMVNVVFEERVPVLISGLGSPKDAKTAVDTLNSASGFLRRELTTRVSLKTMPFLSFVPDHSIEMGTHLLKKITEVRSEDSSEETSHDG